MGIVFATPTPKTMNKNMAPRLPNLPCFEAFGGHISYFVQMFVHIFALYVGAWVTSVLLNLVDFS